MGGYFHAPPPTLTRKTNVHKKASEEGVNWFIEYFLSGGCFPFIFWNWAFFEIYAILNYYRVVLVYTAVNGYIVGSKSLFAKVQVTFRKLTLFRFRSTTIGNRQFLNSLTIVFFFISISGLDMFLKRPRPSSLYNPTSSLFMVLANLLCI